MQDLWRLSATDLAALIKSKQVAAGEAATAALARLDAVNPKLNAVVDHKPAEVLAEAAAIDAKIARGEDAGILAGVPVTVKVNIDQAGFATTNGLKIQKEAIARDNSPVIDNFRKAGAVILGRTNCPAFSYRWFTTNLVHGDTKNPRDPGVTPGGSSGGAGSAVAAGIGHIAHGTDIAGSIRYPAYANGVHGLRPTVGRIAAFNAALPERTIAAQISAVSGPLARTIADLRAALAAMSGFDARDPWWVPAPLEGPPRARRAAICLNPDGLDPVPEVKAAVADAGKRLARAGWTVEEVANTPPLREAADWQTKLWLGDSYEVQLATAEREGDPGALACLNGNKSKVFPFDAASFSKALTRRATLAREWLLFLEQCAVLVMPVSGELPFPDHLDRKDDASFARVWKAQMPQVAIPFMGLPGLTVTTGLVGRVPVGVQVVSGRFREDLCLAAGEAIEAGGVPSSPVDPAS
jgi:amidase